MTRRSKRGEGWIARRRRRKTDRQTDRQTDREREREREREGGGAEGERASTPTIVEVTEAYAAVRCQ